MVKMNFQDWFWTLPAFPNCGEHFINNSGEFRPSNIRKKIILLHRFDSTIYICCELNSQEEFLIFVEVDLEILIIFLQEVKIQLIWGRPQASNFCPQNRRCHNSHNWCHCLHYSKHILYSNKHLRCHLSILLSSGTKSEHKEVSWGFISFCQCSLGKSNCQDFSMFVGGGTTYINWCINFFLQSWTFFTGEERISSICWHHIVTFARGMKQCLQSRPYIFTWI